MHLILNGFVNGERLFVMTNNGAVWLYEGPSPRQLKLVYLWHNLVKYPIRLSSNIYVAPPNLSISLASPTTNY